MNLRQAAPAALALAAYALLGWFVFPGRTWLQSDTQIYVPILERQHDASLFARDEIALRPHVKFTFYDEIAVGLRRLTGAGFEAVLAGQQLLFRGVGVAGAYLVGLALGLPPAGALAAAALFGLGAVINGPAVLTLEYEPVPRGFAVLWLMLALGLAMRRKWMWAGAAAVIATLYHPTTSAPFWVCLLLHWRYAHDRREGIALELSVAAAAAGLAVIALLQPFGADRQVMLGRIPPELEQIQKYRGAYNWISLWPAGWLWQYPLLAALGLTLTWGAYAFFKKWLPMGPSEGFLLEVLILSPFALLYLGWLMARGQSHFLAGDVATDALLLGCGVVTAVPLLLYAHGAKLLRLSTIGILQYISPTLVALVAVAVLGEHFGPARMVAFPMIWAALAIYTASFLRQARAAGADIRGYLAWTLLDNLEWSGGRRIRFGLVRVEPDSLERRPKASFRWFAGLIGSAPEG